MKENHFKFFVGQRVSTNFHGDNKIIEVLILSKIRAISQTGKMYKVALNGIEKPASWIDEDWLFIPDQVDLF